MPKGSYDRSVKLTDDEKRKRRSEYQKQYREKNRDRLLKKHREYNCEKRDVLNEKSRQYYAKNRDQCSKKAKERYAENRDAVKAKVSRYAKENPDVRRRANKNYCRNHPDAVRIRKARQRAVKRKATVGDSASIAAWQKKWRSRSTVACHWCRKRVKTVDVHVDHIVPLSKGGAHAVENLCVSCARCNLKKHDTLPDAWNSKLGQPLLFV